MVVEEHNFNEVIYSVIDYLLDQGIKDIDARVEDYDDPARIVRKGQSEGYKPDLVAKTPSAICVFEVEPAKDINKRAVSAKWRLFSDYAINNNGKFFLIIPEGKEELVRHLLNEMDIEADLLQISGMNV